MASCVHGGLVALNLVAHLGRGGRGWSRYLLVTWTGMGESCFARGIYLGYLENYHQGMISSHRQLEVNLASVELEPDWQARMSRLSVKDVEGPL